MTVSQDRVAVPYLVATVIEPEAALDGTVTTIWPAESEMTDAFLPPTVTFLAEPRPNPKIAMVPPRLTVVGEKEVMDGATWNVAVLDAVPAGVVTLMLPSAAPAGTVAVTEVGISVNTTAGVPANITAEAPPRLLPVIVTDPPGAALVGVNDAMDGKEAYVASPCEQLLATLDQVPWTVTVPVASFRLNTAPGPVAT